MKPIWGDSGGIQVFFRKYGQTGFSDVFIHTLSERNSDLCQFESKFCIFSTYNCTEKSVSNFIYR